jgi:RNA recognition motif-containing protein
VLVEADPAVRVRLGMDRATGKPRGFAFAEFSDAARAADAIRRFDSFEMGGRRLRVNDADDKPAPRAPRPMGGPRPGGAPPMQAFNGGGFGAPGGFGGEFEAGGFGGGGDNPAFRRKGGSRRGLRGKKRSLR